ncbi:MAG: sensor histidine kinase, partial [Bacteroidota bacterium]
HLNNELINNKRELMRKNQKIEFLNQELNAVNENMKMFTYSVSHDLKEPVRMVRSFLGLLHKKYGENLDKKGQTYMDLALDGANRLSNMLADLLVYHQSSNISTTEIVDLNDVVLEVKKILQKEIEEKNARVTSEKLPTLKGSSTGFLQVFQNLISNAIKFVSEGETPIVSIHLRAHETNHIILVKDNGIGISENQKQEAFNLFKRLNAPQQYEGTGMGLAMVKKTIERMGGEVWLESEKGKGTTFFISIKKSIES